MSLDSTTSHDPDACPPRVADLVAFLDDVAPPRLAEEWDNVGLLVGDHAASVTRAMTCLTLTPDVAAEAIDAGANLVVTHHPVLFRGTKRLTTATIEGRMLLDLVRANVAVHSPHTAYDSAASGVNRQLAEAFGLEDVTPLRSPTPVGRAGGVGPQLTSPLQSAPESNEESLPDDGSGRHGKLPTPEPLRTFVARVGCALNLAHVQYVGGDDRSVHRVAVACGAAGEFLEDALRLGCDAFVTGETRFHTCLEARTANIGLVLLGHYASERPALETLATRLAARFPSIEAWASRVERDPIRWM